MKKLNKKGQVFSQMTALATGIATLTIVLVVTFLVLAQGKTQAIAIEGADGSAYNATTELQGAVDDIPGWVPLIVIAVVGSILLGLVKLFR